MQGSQMQRKPRILCLHGFRTSGEILKKMIMKWPHTILEKLDLEFPDAQLPAKGKSGVEGLYDPPYYEWYQYDEKSSEYSNFENCLSYIENYMIKQGPFDGLLGFSQGAMLAAVLPGMQREGVALAKVPKIKFVILISGSKFQGLKFGLPKLAVNAFAAPMECPSLHFIGEKDFLKSRGIALLQSFVNPDVILHSMGHTVPKLDGKGQETLLKFIAKIRMLSNYPQAALQPKASL